MEITFIFFFAAIVMALPYFLLGNYDDHILDKALHCDNIPHNGSPGTGGEIDYQRERVRRINCLMHAKWAIDDDDEKRLEGMATSEMQEVYTEDFDRSDVIDIEADVVEATEQPKLETEQAHIIKCNNTNNTNQVNDVQYNTWKKIEAMKARIEQLQQQLNNKNYGSINN